MPAIRVSLLSAAVLAAAATSAGAWEGGWTYPPRFHHRVRPYAAFVPRPAAGMIASGRVAVRAKVAVFPVCATWGPCGPEAVVTTARPILSLPVSPITGQPLVVVYNSPTSFPGAVDPEIAIVPFPRVRRAPLQGTYPSTY